MRLIKRQRFYKVHVDELLIKCMQGQGFSTILPSGCWGNKVSKVCTSQCSYHMDCLKLYDPRVSRILGSGTTWSCGLSQCWGQLLATPGLRLGASGLVFSGLVSLLIFNWEVLIIFKQDVYHISFLQEFLPFFSEMGWQLRNLSWNTNCDFCSNCMELLSLYRIWNSNNCRTRMSQGASSSIIWL